MTSFQADRCVNELARFPRRPTHVLSSMGVLTVSTSRVVIEMLRSTGIHMQIDFHACTPTLR